MPYLVVEDFKSGLDTRRMPLTSPVGTLQQAKNVHITRGGEIEKAKALVQAFALPPIATFGFASLATDMYVFGSGGDPGVPTGIKYQSLSAPNGALMTAIVSVKPVQGKLYVVALYADGKQHHFYDGQLVADWDNGIVVSSEVTMTGVAAAMAAYINADPAAIVSATSAGAVITITADATNAAFSISGAAVNGGIINDQTIVFATTTPASVGVAQVSTATLGGTFDPGDMFTIIIGDNYYGASSVTGQIVNSLAVLKNKVYTTSGVTLLFSGVAEPAHWRPQDTGAGSIDISSQGPSSENLTALGIYQNSLAIFSRFSTQIWAVFADPAQNTQLQVLDNIGTRSPKSVLSYGDTDVFFLADSGIRSLKARDASNSAAINDVGTPIDTLVIADMRALTDAQIVGAAGVIHPTEGRYLLAVGPKIYTFSYFPSSKVSAWSTYEKAIEVSDWVKVGNQVFARSGDFIYVLGGVNDDQYDAIETVVELPYFDAGKIDHFKCWMGWDLAVEGTWTVYFNTDPNFPDVWELVGTLDKHNIGELASALQGFGQVFKFKFVNNTAGYARIGKVVLHYLIDDEKIT